MENKIDKNINISLFFKSFKLCIIDKKYFIFKITKFYFFGMIFESFILQITSTILSAILVNIP